MSQVEPQISGGRDSQYDDAVYQAAKKLVDSVESSAAAVDPKLKRRSGTNVLADAAKFDKCPAPLVGCSASELYKATGGELTCPELGMAPDPLIVDGKGRVCYAKEDILSHWMEVGPDGKRRYKKISIENLINKYSQELLEKFLDPSNKKLLIAASQAARNGFNIPPIILNFYKYNPFVYSFTQNRPKYEDRMGLRDGKRFRGLKQFTYDNGYADYQTQEIFATVLSNFTNNLELTTGAEFLSIMMTPTLRTPETVRGIFDIYCPQRNFQLDFLGIDPYERSEAQPASVIHAVNANICELMFTGIAAFSRDTVRIEKFTKMINSLGEMLKFGELAPEYENPENKCRQAGVAANNAVSFLPITLKKWLSDLPSTWRRAGPTITSQPDHAMIQREDGRKPHAHGRGCRPIGTGGNDSANGANDDTRFVTSVQDGETIDTTTSTSSTSRSGRGLLSSALAEAAAASAAAASAAASAGAASAAGTGLRYVPRGGAASASSRLNPPPGLGLLLRSVGADGSLSSGPPPSSGVGMSGGESLEGGALVRYPVTDEVEVQGERRHVVANPASVESDVGDRVIQDPRMILQNFVALCFYLNWVESFAHASSDDSIISMFKSLRVSYEAAMAARSNVEELLKIKAEESSQRAATGQNFKSAVTDKMAEEALAAKKGADASYMGTNVRIAKKLAFLLDIGWDKCKSMADLTSPSSDLNQNSWHDKMLPHQNLIKVIAVDPISAPGGGYYNLRFTVNQMPGLGHNELVAAPPGPAVDETANPYHYPDYPDAVNDTWRSAMIYQNMPDTLGVTGVNTRQFRRAWKNTGISFDGIKSKKNHIARVGHMQLMSRIMDLHLTFCQSSEAGRNYFIKMHEWSLLQTRRTGIPEDPRASALNFDDPGHEMSNYKQFAQVTKNLLQPLPSVNVCKVVVGESQYFVYKTARNDLGVDERRRLALLARTRLEYMYSAYRNTVNDPHWWNEILHFGNGNVGVGAGGQLNAQQQAELASYIIEYGVDYVATSNGPLGRPVRQEKMFGACEPLDTSDFYMFNRRKKFLDTDRPEDELFLLGVEGIAKYLNQDDLWVDNRRPDPQFARRREVRAAGAAGAAGAAAAAAAAAPVAGFPQSERLAIRDTPQDTLRRRSTIDGLNADERDLYARYIIFMTKVSGGSPGRLAQYLLEVNNGDANIQFNAAGAANPGQYQDPPRFIAKPAPAVGAAIGPRTLREGIAMSLVYVVRNPTPLFASMGTLHGGEEAAAPETLSLTGGSAEGGEVSAGTVEALDIDAEIDYVLTGGLKGGLNENIQQFDPPRHIREAISAAKEGLTYEERELQKKLHKLGRKEIAHYEVGAKCPVSLTKYNNLFGKSGSAEWVETKSPWVKCQEKMGFQFKTNSGYCYPADDKCYPSQDIKSATRSTAELLQNWQQIAKLTNSLKQVERENALQEARRMILSDDTKQNISHSELEELAHRMLPANLRMLPDKVAMESVIAVSEDIEGQVREMSDSSDQEQKAILRKLLWEHRLLYDRWQDPNKEQQAEYLNDLTKELVDNAKICANVSLAISAQSSSAMLKQNMRGALNYASSLVVGGAPSLPNEFVQSLPEDTQVLVRSTDLASKCEVRPLYERGGVILPAQINAMLPPENDGADGEEIFEVKNNGLINWWKQYHASTMERRTKRSDKLSKSIDPTIESSTTHPDREETLAKQLHSALDGKGLELLSEAEAAPSRVISRSRGSRSRSRSRR